MKLDQELSVDDACVEIRRLFGRRKHSRAEAGASDAADGAQVGGTGRQSRLPARRRQHHPRIRRASRASAL